MHTVDSQDLGDPGPNDYVNHYSDGVTIKGPTIRDKARITVDGPIVFNTDIGEDNVIRANGIRQSIQGTHNGYCIQAGRHVVGARSKLNAHRGIHAGSCAEGAKLFSRNGLIYIDGNIGPNVHVENQWGDVFIHGRIQGGSVIKGRNIAIAGPVESDVTLNPTEAVYVREEDLGPKVKIEGATFSPSGWRRHLGNPIFRALNDGVVGIAHEPGEPPSGWKTIRPSPVEASRPKRNISRQHQLAIDASKDGKARLFVLIADDSRDKQTFLHALGEVEKAFGGRLVVVCSGGYHAGGNIAQQMDLNSANVMEDLNYFKYDEDPKNRDKEDPARQRGHFPCGAIYLHGGEICRLPSDIELAKMGEDPQSFVRWITRHAGVRIKTTSHAGAFTDPTWGRRARW